MKSATIILACKGGYFSRNSYRSNVVCRLKELGFTDLGNVRSRGGVEMAVNYGINNYMIVDRKHSDHMVGDRTIDLVVKYYDDMDKILKLETELKDINGVHAVKTMVAAEDFKKPYER